MKRLIAITSICALLAAPALAQDKAEEAAEETTPPTAEEVDAAVTTINGIAEDKEKVAGYCTLSKEMEAVPEGDEAKIEEVAKKMDDYLSKLGEDVLDAFAIADAVDPETEEGKKIDAAFGALEEKCSA